VRAPHQKKLRNGENIISSIVPGIAFDEFEEMEI
jgi:hypothetical protein